MIEQNKIKDSFVGTLVGCGVGDSLGLFLETMSLEQIRTTFSIFNNSRPGFVTDYLEPFERVAGEPHYFSKFKRGEYSDDTQGTISLGESIIYNKEIDPNDIARRLVTTFYENEIKQKSWGKAVTQGVVRLAAGEHWTKTGIDSAGNGVVMKISPVGLFYSLNNSLSATEFNEKLVNDCKNISIMTHRNSQAVVSGCVQSKAIDYIIRNNVVGNYKFDVDDFFNNIIDFSKKAHYLSGFSGTDPEPYWDDKLKQVYDLVKSDASVEDAVGELGSKAYCMESLAFSLFCFGKYPSDLEECIIQTVNAGGDTDSNGAIVGALCGVLQGNSAIPLRWKEGLEDYDKICDVGEQLYFTALNQK